MVHIVCDVNSVFCMVSGILVRYLLLIIKQE
jgi:hypothetical protein